MACTTVLVGKKATYNGSTMISRNDDNPAGEFAIKKWAVIQPEDQPRLYRSVISHVEIPLEDNPMAYTAMPDSDTTKKGIWAAAGVNSDNVAMSATETITTNERVLGGDPLVVYQPAKEDQEEKPGGIGEEDIVVLVLPYIHSAREGVIRLGRLLEKYGTYESNGVAFSDVDEVWYLETIGGHHWIARRLPDDCYAVLPNQFGNDEFDLEDALGEQKNFMASADLKEFIADNHLDLSMDGQFNARDAFGSHSDSDHVYNTPRAWFGQRYFNPRTVKWEGEDAQFTPTSDDLPWCRRPERKITVEDVKYIQSSTFQGTPYDVFAQDGKEKYRPIGVNRTGFLHLIEIRPDLPEAIAPVEWLAFASNVYNAFVPFYTHVDRVPEYMGNTTDRISTDNFYWANRLISALADSQHAACAVEIERYQGKVQAQARAILHESDKAFDSARDEADRYCEMVNEKMADMVRKETDALLDKVLFIASCKMKNSFSRSDN